MNFDWTNLKKEIPMVSKHPLGKGMREVVLSNIIGLDYSGFMRFITIHNSNLKAKQLPIGKSTDSAWDHVNLELLECVRNAKKQLKQNNN